MTERKRSDRWLLGLALAGGVLDAASYFGLGKVFTANMTGNTVLLAVAVARGSGTDAVRSAVALGGFSAGAAVAVMLTRHTTRPWPGRAGRAFMLEMIGLVTLLVLWAVIGVAPIRLVLIAVSAVVMGVQSAAVRASDVRGVNTTYMTSTLLNAIARSVRRSRGVPEAEEGPSLPGAAWVTYGAGALVCALALPVWRAGVVGVALVAVGPVAVAAALQMRKENH